MLAFATSIKILAKIDENWHVLGGIDFGSILERFWEGSGKPKSLIFTLFFNIFSMQTFDCNLEGQKIEKKNFNIFFPAIFTVSAALGGRIIGWGEACLSLKFEAWP